MILEVEELLLYILTRCPRLLFWQSFVKLEKRASGIEST